MGLVAERSQTLGRRTALLRHRGRAGGDVEVMVIAVVVVVTIWRLWGALSIEFDRVLLSLAGGR